MKKLLKVHFACVQECKKLKSADPRFNELITKLEDLTPKEFFAHMDQKFEKFECYDPEIQYRLKSFVEESQRRKASKEVVAALPIAATVDEVHAYLCTDVKVMIDELASGEPVNVWELNNTPYIFLVENEPTPIVSGKEKRFSLKSLKHALAGCKVTIHYGSDFDLKRLGLI